MKEIIKIVPFFINPDNMRYLLKGKVIKNFNEMHNGLFESIKRVNKCNVRLGKSGIYPIYEAREKGSIHKSEYADMSDEIIAKIVRYIKNDNGYNALEIEVINSLKFCKLNNPVIKINGYSHETEDGDIIVNEITRLTLGSRLTNN